MDYLPSMVASASAGSANQHPAGAGQGLAMNRRNAPKYMERRTANRTEPGLSRGQSKCNVSLRSRLSSKK
jgi:hypothetical protein